jgi:hypothetical protein
MLISGGGSVARGMKSPTVRILTGIEERKLRHPEGSRSFEQSCVECPAWQSLGESNPSFQVENLTS